MSCTGVASRWCPHCGDCTCPRGDDGHGSFVERARPDSWHALDVEHDPACPLHGDGNTHCQPDPHTLPLFPEDDSP